MEERRALFFFFSSRRRHTRFDCDWSSDVCSSDLLEDTLRAGRVPVNIIRGTMDAVGKAGRLLEKVAAAGKAAVEQASKKAAEKENATEKVEETPPGQ